MELLLAWLDGLLEGVEKDVDYYKGLDADSFSAVARFGAEKRLETLQQVRKRVVKVLEEGSGDND
jgi:hypothetical protein